MLSIIPPTVKGVSAALVSPKQPSFFRIKSAAGGGARRALASLGSNNAQFNMNMAKSHLAMVQEGFANRWNFNPEKEVPLAPRRYQWAPIGNDSDKEITKSPSEKVLKDSTLLKDITNPVLTNSPPSLVAESKNLIKSSQIDLEMDCTVPSVNDQENAENNAKLETKCSQVPSPSCDIIADSKKNATAGSQMCVTDFFRPQKRKTLNHCEDCQPNTGTTPPKKKLRTVI